ncbi:hypothetical protein P3S67_016051 [Capsicum chacoense]
MGSTSTGGMQMQDIPKVMSQVSIPQDFAASGRGTPVTQPFYFTKDQYEQIVQMLNGTSSHAMANSAGISGIDTTCLTVNSQNDWIIDTGATNHMVVEPGLLTNSVKLESANSRKVLLPTGDS